MGAENFRQANPPYYWWHNIFQKVRGLAGLTYNSFPVILAAFDPCMYFTKLKQWKISYFIDTYTPQLVLLYDTTAELPYFFALIFTPQSALGITKQAMMPPFKH